MQQLLLELKNIPTDVFQVCSSISLRLNMVERPSVLDKVLDCNNLDGNQRQQTGGLLKSFVFVLDFNGYSLMQSII